ncbi:MULTISPECIES: response regulator transcription factor [Pseudomonas]|uniref:Response regulator n=1 Tax=Pseudomonas sp. Hg7Tf TaxID=3236988 RepID=A0AB39I6S0_9PSED|nr:MULTISPECIES: response regulator transcription factor [Pseudomonas]KJK09946.1 LuxR family transcriptional regulator [Pseudomonas sp. 5]MDD1978765.1 response regulator transcription factor [Pseudomonas putida]MDH2558598.1 response regulator transcription factor [Pseudomonas sp. Hg5Tf]QYX48462.1 response regulator transcription factor [Pseudomonas sp. S11A 273]
MTTVLIVDDHSTVRFAVRLLLERADFTVVGEAHDGEIAWQLARELRPDVVILDIGLPGIDGLSVLRRLQGLEPVPPRILVLTGQPPELFARRCLDGGASAFVRKDEDLRTLVSALKAMIKGYSIFPELTTQHGPLLSEQQRLDKLSDQELAVLRLLAEGQSNNDIAEHLHLSPKTVSTYKTRILEKLELGSFAALLDLCRRHSI